MRKHRVQLATLSALIAVTAIGCTGGANGTTTSVGSSTTSSTLLVPYVALTADATPYVAVDPALTVTAQDATVAADGACSAVTPSSATAPARTSLLTTATSGAGEFAVNLVDAPNPIVSEMWITVDSVSAHVAGQGWIPLKAPGTDPFFFNLLSLKGGVVPMELGFAQLPADSKVTQIRLLLSTQIVVANPTSTTTTPWPQFVNLENAAKTGLTTVELKVPSGYETGIKILGPWTVSGCKRTTVTLDFDGEKSLWYHPNGPETEWILRPVIHAKGTVVSDLACSPTTVVPDPIPVDGGTSGGTTSGGTTTGGSSSGGTPPDTTTTTTTSGTTLVCTTGTGTVTTGSTPPGGSCSAPSECTSGSCVENTCTLAGAGQTCSRGTECLSGTCHANTCTVSDTGQSCFRNGDCASNLCVSGTCSPETTGLPAGSSCSVPAECASGSCYLSICQGGLSGQTCTATSDCVTGLACLSTSYSATPLCVPKMSQ